MKRGRREEELLILSQNRGASADMHATILHFLDGIIGKLVYKSCEEWTWIWEIVKQYGCGEVPLGLF